MERQSASMDIGQVQEGNVVRTAKEGDGSENVKCLLDTNTKNQGSSSGFEATETVSKVSLSVQAPVKAKQVAQPSGSTTNQQFSRQPLGDLNGQQQSCFLGIKPVKVSP